VAGRAIGRGLIFCTALATAWIGFLAVGSWEADDTTTRAGVVLLVGALIALVLAGLSFACESAAPLLWAAATVSAGAWVLAVLLD